jgi:hypothetical protein
MGTGKRMKGHGGSLGHGVVEFVGLNQPGQNFVTEMKKWLSNIGYRFKNDSNTGAVGRALTLNI